MEKKKISRKEKKQILSKVKFELFQIEAIQITVYNMYGKTISKERALHILKILYFKDAAGSLDFLERTYNRRNYYFNKKHNEHI